MAGAIERVNAQSRCVLRRENCGGEPGGSGADDDEVRGTNGCAVADTAVVKGAHKMQFTSATFVGAPVRGTRAKDADAVTEPRAQLYE